MAALVAEGGTVHGGGSAEGRTGPADGRRELTIVVLATAGSALLALFAASRTWVARGAPDETLAMVADRSGSELVPAFPALIIVAIAGAGALVASRGWARAAVSVLLMLSGLGIAALAVPHMLDVDGGRAVWPALVFIGGGMIAAAGLRALLRRQTYPSMGTRYEREAREPADGDLWAAIDRGDDPTRD